MILKYDVIVIGGGHAGCEAACAAARIGAATCLVTMDMNKIAQMSCNPAVGGIAKGQIVREIDALGGQMGIVTDQSSIQFRMLNRSKGPAMWSPRAQCDREKFIWQWRKRLDETEHLDIWQDQADELLVENGAAVGVKTIWGAELRAKAVVITAGTFLNGLLHVGRKMVAGGRIAEPAVTNLTESIAQNGISYARMKTGTPVRIDRRSVDFDLMEEQPGENPIYAFSYLDTPRPSKQLPCWTLKTNEEVHRILLGSIAESPLFNGQIQSIGPRYCPSIETKLTTFPDRDSHPLFLEPEGEDTNEMYLNGFSSSHADGSTDRSAAKDTGAGQCESVSARLCHRIRLLRSHATEALLGVEESERSLLCRTSERNNRLRRGSRTGTGGRRERRTVPVPERNGETTHPPFVMHRDESYIGVLIDDLVTKGVDEPYRMFTSRAEYRILLRQDDADARLTERAYHWDWQRRER